MFIGLFGIIIIGLFGLNVVEITKQAQFNRIFFAYRTVKRYKIYRTKPKMFSESELQNLYVTKIDIIVIDLSEKACWGQYATTANNVAIEIIVLIFTNKNAKVISDII